MNDCLFHIYIGTVYQGPQRGFDAEHAIMLYSEKTGKSRFVFNAKPAGRIQDLKKPGRVAIERKLRENNHG